MPDWLLALLIAGGVIGVFTIGLFARRLPGSDSISLASVDSRLKAVEAKLDTNEREVKAIGVQVTALPSKETVHRLELKVAELSGEFKGVIQSLNATSHAVQRVESFLLQASANAVAGVKTDGAKE